MAEDEDQPAHHELGASGAHRWRRCPGSVALSRGLSGEAGIDAAMGTVFHEVAALCLEFGLDAWGFVGYDLDIPPHGVIEFDHEMATYLQEGLDRLRAMIGEGDVVLVERRVDLSGCSVPGNFGTTDVTIISLARWKIIVWDWKYGAGVPVHPEENDQAIMYFLGVWDTYAADIFTADPAWPAFDVSGADMEVEIWIEQPRAPGGGGVWNTTLDAMLRAKEEIKRDALATLKPDAPLVPGEKQCRFCKAKTICKARAEYILGQLDLDLAGLEVDALVGNPLTVDQVLTPEARSHLLEHRPMIESFLKELHDAAMQDAKHGRPVPGWKLGYGRAPARKWADEAQAEKALKRQLGEDAYLPRKLASPAQVETVIGKAKFRNTLGNMVTQAQPKVILVRADHPGPEVLDYTSDLPEPENS